MIYSDHRIEIGRAIMTRLAPGKSIELPTKGAADPYEVIEYARKFGASRGRKIVGEFVSGGNRIRLTEIKLDRQPRCPGRPKLSPDRLKYPIGSLGVGESVLVRVPETDYSKVRKAASARAKDMGWKLSCSAREDGILVTRTA